MMNGKDKYIKLLRQFKANYGEEYGITKMEIFGSIARNSYNSSSDIDVFYEGNVLVYLMIGI